MEQTELEYRKNGGRNMEVCWSVRIAPNAEESYSWDCVNNVIRLYLNAKNWSSLFQLRQKLVDQLPVVFSNLELGYKQKGT